MSRNILLARPHPFIVAEMKPFLEQNGYSPRKVHTLADIPGSTSGAAGAIISLAVVSSIGESAETVFNCITQIRPATACSFCIHHRFCGCEEHAGAFGQKRGFHRSYSRYRCSQRIQSSIGQGGHFPVLEQGRSRFSRAARPGDAHHQAAFSLTMTGTRKRLLLAGGGHAQLLISQKYRRHLDVQRMTVPSSDYF